MYFAWIESKDEESLTVIDAGEADLQTICHPR